LRHSELEITEMKTQKGQTIVCIGGIHEPVGAPLERWSAYRRRFEVCNVLFRNSGGDEALP
jgi:hypothetical protein